MSRSRFGLTSTAALILGVVAALSGCAPTTTSPEPSPTASISRPGINVIPAPTGVALPFITGSARSQPSLPWSLIRVDHTNNRIYLSADSAALGCTTPIGVQLEETTQAVTIRVVGTSAESPCTAQMMTLIGYVITKAPIGSRHIEHAATH